MKQVVQINALGERQSSERIVSCFFFPFFFFYLTSSLKDARGNKLVRKTRFERVSSNADENSMLQQWRVIYSFNWLSIFCYSMTTWRYNDIIKQGSNSYGTEGRLERKSNDQSGFQVKSLVVVGIYLGFLTNIVTCFFITSLDNEQWIFSRDQWLDSAAFFSIHSRWRWKIPRVLNLLRKSTREFFIFTRSLFKTERITFICQNEN